jgi:hypothetical protein
MYGETTTKCYKAVCVERLPLKVTLQIAGLLIEIGTGYLKTRRANMQVSVMTLGCSASENG